VATPKPRTAAIAPFASPIGAPKVLALADDQRNRGGCGRFIETQHAPFKQR